MKGERGEASLGTYLTKIKRITFIKVSRSLYDTFYLSISNARLRRFVEMRAFFLIFLSADTFLLSLSFSNFFPFSLSLELLSKVLMARAKRRIAKFKSFLPFVRDRALLTSDYCVRYICSNRANAQRNRLRG